MATYEYRCGSCGTSFAVQRRIGTAASTESCPRCSAASSRVFTAPLLSLSDPSVRGLRAAEERSSDTPEVVTRPPARPRPKPRTERNPLWSKLPKP